MGPAATHTLLYSQGQICPSREVDDMAVAGEMETVMIKTTLEIEREGGDEG